MTRAERRRRAERAKREAVARWRRRGVPDADGTMVGRLAATPHPCSCGACGNRRAADGPTVQEERQRQPTGEEHST